MMVVLAESSAGRSTPPAATSESMTRSMRVESVMLSRRAAGVRGGRGGRLPRRFQYTR
jgi:hypothetical protein